MQHKISKNPFEYEAANNLPEDDIIDFYIEDYNYSRFINSTRNIFLLGERGSGKTMTLLYHSVKVQYKKKRRASDTVTFDNIGIHIPCNTPLFHKKEYLLFKDDFKASVLCEHYLVLTILFSICDGLKGIEELKTLLNNDTQLNDFLFDEFEYLIATNDLDHSKTFIDAVWRYVARELNTTQRKINSENADSFYENAFSFSSIVIPFIKVIKNVKMLQHAHFLLMIDDAHDLNKFQIRTLNSWIAYRDHSDFSFKVATAKISRPEFITSTGGTILEGHDFITIDMEKSFQNERSDFYQMAKDILERRLAYSGNKINIDDFFPQNELTKVELEKCKEKVSQAYKLINPSYSTKQLNDHVYKYYRAEYFRSRSSKANLPPYSGFETIVDVSTGVIRNLLDPCYWMFDAALSQKKDNTLVTSINPAIQNRIFLERSQIMWERLRSGLDKEVEGCSIEQAKYIYNLFENLTILFKRRLLESISEPRAITFTISQINKETDRQFKNIEELLNIAQRSQFLYTRVGSSKNFGKQEIYYVPNRMLMPAKGLDPHGQYSRVSLKLTDMWNAAFKNQEFPFAKHDDDTYLQGQLFL
jgi:hypothetical protein